MQHQNFNPFHVDFVKLYILKPVEFGTGNTELNQTKPYKPGIKQYVSQAGTVQNGTNLHRNLVSKCTAIKRLNTCNENLEHGVQSANQAKHADDRETRSQGGGKGDRNRNCAQIKKKWFIWNHWCQKSCLILVSMSYAIPVHMVAWW